MKPHVPEKNNRAIAAPAGALDFEIEWAEDVLRFRVFDRISSGALLDAVRSLTADDRYKQLRFFLVDFLEPRWCEASLLALLEELLPIFLSASSRNPEAQIGLVSRDPYIVELANTIVRFDWKEHPQVHVFTDRIGANDWATQTSLH